MKKFPPILVALVMATPTYAEDTIKGLVYGQYILSSDGDIKVSGTTYDGDSSGMGFSGRFYLSDSVYVAASMASTEVTVVGVTIDGDTKAFGGGLAFGGRIDYRDGSGSEQRFGLSASDVKISLGSISSTENYTDLIYAGEYGLGNGLTLGVYFSTDTGDLFSDNSYSGALYKSLGGGLLIGASYGFSKNEIDANNGSDASQIVIGFGFAF